MNQKPKKIELPDLGSIIAAIDGETPPHKLLVQFFQKWWSLREQPAFGEYRLLYIALSKLLPQVVANGWPKEEFKYWVNHGDSALITRHSTFKRIYLDRFGPFFDAVEFVRQFEEGTAEGYIVGCRKARKQATKAKVAAAKEANPDATDKQIGEVVGVTGRRVGQIREGNEKEAKPEPKLLSHGGNMAEQGSYDNLGRGKPYIIARLQRDGYSDLADQVKAGKLSARAAAMEAGFKVPESQLTALKRHWKKASEAERSTFIAWQTTSGAP